MIHSERDRYRGYCRALIEAGIPLNNNVKTDFLQAKPSAWYLATVYQTDGINHLNMKLSWLTVHPEYHIMHLWQWPYH